jgi:chemotaxis protein histidine kinase CheA
VTGQTINGTKRPGVPMLGPLTPIHLGGIPTATPETPTAPTEEPTVAAEPAYDPIKHAEADRIRDLAKAEADALRIEAEGKAKAAEIKAEQEARAKKITNDKAEAKAKEEQAARETRIAQLNRLRDEANRASAEDDAEKAAQEAAEAERAKEIAKADEKWRKYAIRFAVVCGIVALPVQVSAFWNPQAPWLAAAPVMLEAGAWVVQRGAAAAVANRRPLWHYRVIAWTLACVAAAVNLFHGLSHFDPATAYATAFASLAGPGVWDLHEHGRIRKRDGVLTRRERKAKESAEKAAAKEKAAREAAVKAEKDAAAKAAKDAAEKLAADRKNYRPKVWEHALKLAADLGETTVTETVWRRAHKDVEGTDPGDSAEAQQLRNTAARKLLDARADAPDKTVWKAQDAQVNSQVPPTRRRGSVTGPPVRGVRRPGDTAPFVDAARKQAAITAKNTTEKTPREDS